MMVEMVKLRSRGKRLDADGVRRQRPVIGLLRVGPEPEARHACKADRAAVLLPPGDSHVALAELHAVMLHQVDLRGLVLVGTEETYVRKMRHEHRQAWWCRPVTEGELVPSTAPDPIDTEEEREQLEAALEWAEGPPLAPHTFGPAR